MASDEKIVLSVTRNGIDTVPSMYRLERLKEKEVHEHDVLYTAGGPFLGMIINKTVKSIKDRPKPEAIMGFICNIIGTRNSRKQIKESRRLYFWFDKKVPKQDKMNKAGDFFDELLDPESFPQELTLFIKKTLVMMQKYTSVRCLDVAIERSDYNIQDDLIEETCKVHLNQSLTAEMSMSMYGDSERGASMDEPDDDENVVRNYITVLTPNQYDYQFVPEVPVSNKSFLTFSIKAHADAHIALSAIYGALEQKTYEITLGGKNNTRSWICENAEGHKRAEALTRNILGGEESKNFWVSWKDGLIEVGEGSVKGRRRFMFWRTPEKKKFSINCMAVSTDKTSSGEWEFVDIVYPEKDKAQRRAKARASLLWLAKKQRMLTTLEDAYPDSLPTPQLLRLAKIKPSDMMTAVVMLKEMKTKELIKEVTQGFWMRMPGGMIGGKESKQNEKHEVKMVTNMPILTGREQPTIAIISTIYCEKQAVDAMISNKTTYVRYVKQGDSSVYTLGHIGSHQVISTKLSRVGRGREAQTSAENAITRLLGTFNKIDHVILVGVAGAVPHYTDYYKHVRLGDVVVTAVDDYDDPLYIFCEKMEIIDGEFNFSTKTWKSKTTLLQGIAKQLQEQAQMGGNRPWEGYIDEARESLLSEDSPFYRPATKTDRLYHTTKEGDLVEYEHPQPPDGALHRENQPNIKFGPVGSGRFISRNEQLRQHFSTLSDVIAYDYEFDAVLDSLEGNRCDSFLVIRGIADYSDGVKQKEWQPYASLAAAAFMKSIVETMMR